MEPYLRPGGKKEVHPPSDPVPTPKTGEPVVEPDPPIPGDPIPNPPPIYFTLPGTCVEIKYLIYQDVILLKSGKIKAKRDVAYFDSNGNRLVTSIDFMGLFSIRLNLYSDTYRITRHWSLIKMCKYEEWVRDNGVDTFVREVEETVSTTYPSPTSWEVTSYSETRGTALIGDILSTTGGVYISTNGAWGFTNAYGSFNTPDTYVAPLTGYTGQPILVSETLLDFGWDPDLAKDEDPVEAVAPIGDSVKLLTLRSRDVILTSALVAALPSRFGTQEASSSYWWEGKAIYLTKAELMITLSDTYPHLNKDDKAMLDSMYALIKQYPDNTIWHVNVLSGSTYGDIEADSTGF